MSFFGKIKTAVMGNPVTREYEVGRQVASAGPGLMWKVHQAVKKSTRQEMSVFLFNKQTPEFEKLHKKQREQILEVLRKDPNHLVRLKHPRILTVDHPLQESNDCLAFATESVTIGLSNILGNYDNLPSPLPLAIKEYEVHPIEIQYGLFNLSEALEFLHCGVKLLHGNITPEVVVVTGGGTWKLMGFNFSCYSQYQSETTTTFQFQEWDSRRPHNTNPSLDFLAPEYILTKSCSEKSDIFSFGMLCYGVYNGGRALCSSLNNLLSFKQNVETISRVSESGLGEVPQGLRTLVRTMLAIEPSVRPDAMEITKHPFFDEVGVATLRYLDTLYEKGDMERSQYFKKNLALVVTKLPKRVTHQRVLPALREEFRNNKMVPFVLPIVLLVAEDCTMQEYSDVIMPILIPALRIQDPIQVPLIILQKMDLLLKKTSPEDVKQHIIPTIIASLETSNAQLQELCITLVPSFATTIDYSSMKHAIIPRLTTLMITSESVSLRVKCLVAVGTMLDSLDKHIVHDHILPLLQQIPSREPGVLMAILGIYHAVMKNKKMGMEKTFLATRVLPFLLPLSVEPTLNIAQFNQFMVVIRDMLQNVEREQQTHLQQLANMEEQTRSTVEFAREVSEAKAMEDTINKFEETFGSGSGDSHVIQKHGASTPSSPTMVGGSSAPLNPLSPQDGYDMFAGLFPAKPDTATVTSFPSPKLTSSHTHTAPSPQTTRGGTGMAVSNMGMKSWTGMGTTTPGLLSSSESPEPTVSFQNTGSNTPVMSQSGSGNRGMGVWNGNSGTGLLKPVDTQPLNPQSLNPQPTAGGGNLFSGMQLHSSMQASKGLTVGGTTTTNQTAGHSHMTSGSDLISGVSPLVPTETRSPTGWSSNVDKSTSVAKPTPNMGWSDSVAPPIQSQDWISQVSGQQSGSMMAPMQPTTKQHQLSSQPTLAPSQDWMSQISSQPSSSMMAPMQPSAIPSGNRMTQNPTTNQQLFSQPTLAPSRDWMSQSSSQPSRSMMAPMQPSAIPPGNRMTQNPTTNQQLFSQPTLAPSQDWMSQSSSQPSRSMMAPMQPSAIPPGNRMTQNPTTNQQLMGSQPSLTPSQDWGAPNQQPMMTPLQPTVTSSNWMSQNQQPAPSTNWMSQNQQAMAPMQPNVAPSQNWMVQAQQPMQLQHQMPPVQSSNWTVQNQQASGVPTAASLMMGGPLLNPTGTHSNQAPPTTTQQSGNPFADLSFLG